MRLLSTIILVGLSGLAARAADWTTTDGKTYKDVKVLKHDALTVTILDTDGGASVPLEKLPGDLQKKFAYDPAKARAEINAKHKAESIETAPLERNATLNKSNEAVSKSAVLLIGTVVDTRSDGYFVTVYEKSRSPLFKGYFGSHGRSDDADHASYSPPNVVAAGTYYLKTKTTFQQDQLVGLVVYPSGSIPDLPYHPIKVFTNELESVGETATARPTPSPLAAPNHVATNSPAKARDFNPGAMSDNVLNNATLTPPPKSDHFNPGSMDDSLPDSSSVAPPPKTDKFNPGSMDDDLLN